MRASSSTVHFSFWTYFSLLSLSLVGKKNVGNDPDMWRELGSRSSPRKNTNRPNLFFGGLTISMVMDYWSNDGCNGFDVSLKSPPHARTRTARLYCSINFSFARRGSSYRQPTHKIPELQNVTDMSDLPGEKNKVKYLEVSWNQPDMIDFSVFILQKLPFFQCDPISVLNLLRCVRLSCVERFAPCKKLTFCKFVWIILGNSHRF